MAIRPLQLGKGKLGDDALVGERAISSLLVRYGASGFVATTAIVLGAAFGGGKFASHLPGAWFFGTAGGPGGSLSSSANPSLVGILAVYGGIALLACTWVSLLRSLWRHPGVPIRQVLLVIGVWALPLLLGPPLFSPDVYSYAGQGELVSHHINPYTYGPGILGPINYNQLSGSVWAQAPSPYGPLFLGLDGLLTIISGHHLLINLVLLRLLALIGIGLAAAGLPTLARAAGRDPSAVMVLGVGSPLVLLTLLAGAHNDALMVGLLVAGLAVARRIGPLPGIILCAMAAAVKSPALLAVVFIGWTWPGPLATTKARVARTAGALGISLLVLAVLSAITGLGWGWLHTQTGETAAVTGVTPVYAVAHVFSGVASLVGLHHTLSAMRVLTMVIGLLAAGAATVWLLLRSPKFGMVQTLGLSLLVVALLSPVLWAWYCSWGLVVLATTATGPLRRFLVVIAVVETFIGVSSVKFMANVLWHKGLLEVLLVALVLTAIVLVWRWIEARHETALEQGDPSLPVEGDGASSGSARVVPRSLADLRQWVRQPFEPIFNVNRLFPPDS